MFTTSTFRALLGSFLLALIPAMVQAEIDPDLTITPKGYGSFEVGQINSGYYRVQNTNYVLRHVWQQRAFANIGMDVSYKDILDIEIVGEGMMAFSSPQIGSMPVTTQSRHYFYIKSSNATITLGNADFLKYALQAGMFQYKYNHDARNLGDYMFRSIPYPTIFYCDFDAPYANLAGLRLNIQGMNKLFSNDLLLHSEIIGFPVQNWSVSDVAEVNLFDIVSVGAGVNFHHILNVYQGEYYPNSYENYFYHYSLLDSTLDRHKATKLMGRLAVDVKTILAKAFNQGDPLPFFNKNDARIYGEIDIMGLEEYEDRFGFGTIADRTFYTFGFNVPGFFVFDLINFEFEYCKNKTAFSDENLTGGSSPNWNASYIVEDGDTLRSPLRWSIYLKKSLFNEHFSLITQFARDHKKLNFHYFDRSAMSFIEATPTKKDWWWVIKTEFKF